MLLSKDLSNFSKAEPKKPIFFLVMLMTSENFVSCQSWKFKIKTSRLTLPVIKIFKITKNSRLQVFKISRLETSLESVTLVQDLSSGTVL